MAQKNLKGGVFYVVIYHGRLAWGSEHPNIMYISDGSSSWFKYPAYNWKADWLSILLSTAAKLGLWSCTVFDHLALFYDAIRNETREEKPNPILFVPFIYKHCSKTVLWKKSFDKKKHLF